MDKYVIEFIKGYLQYSIRIAASEADIGDRMENRFSCKKLEKLIVRDKKFLFTIISYIAILTIFLNLSIIHYAAIGTIATIVYFLINGIFLGQTFFKKETAFFRPMFGLLLLIMLLGFVGWLAVIIYNLDVTRSTLVLFITSTVSSLLNRRVKNKNAT